MNKNLKQGDLFAYEPQFFIKRGSRKKGSKHRTRYGSWLGLVLTLTSIVTCLTYFVFLVNRMLSHEKDIMIS